MRKAISIVLAGLLLMLPVEQVLAQAVQQESVSVQQPVQSDGAARRLRVPPLTESAAQLLRTSTGCGLLDSPFAEPSSSSTNAVVGWSDWSKKKRTWVVVGIVAGIAAVVLLAYWIDSACPTGCGGLGGQP